jgi:replicative DNA helicase
VTEPDASDHYEPPNDVATEQHVLGAMLLAENVIPDVYNRLGDPVHGVESVFYKPAHQMIYAAIMAVNETVRPDPVLVAKHLADTGELQRVGSGPYLHSLMEGVPVPSSAGWYADILIEKHRERRVVQLGQQLIQSRDPETARELMQQWNEQDDRPGTGEAAPGWVAQLAAGGSFVLDVPATPLAVWGEGEQVGWAEGESLLIAGPPGVGKTTLVVQLVAGRLGLGKDVLGMPVQPGDRRVLYLAMDRPPQIARAMARVFGEEHAAILNERLIVWKGPPPADLARNTDLLAQMCRHAGADTVVVDSLKDAVLKLSDDESGSGYNRARQAALVDGVQVVELHHQRKAGGENKKPSRLDDVYGSTWITAGAGSVIGLWGEAGDPVVELNHLKQPMEPLGPWRIAHDHAAGRSEIFHQVDLLQLAQTWKPSGGAGLTAKAAACALFSTDKPTASEVEKARRKLEKYVRDELMVSHPGAGGGADGGTATKYFRAERERP